jgi:hypothetical protein
MPFMAGNKNKNKYSELRVMGCFDGCCNRISHSLWRNNITFSK